MATALGSPVPLPMLPASLTPIPSHETDFQIRVIDRKTRGPLYRIHRVLHDDGIFAEELSKMGINQSLIVSSYVLAGFIPEPETWSSRHLQRSWQGHIHGQYWLVCKTKKTTTD